MVRIRLHGHLTVLTPNIWGRPRQERLESYAEAGVTQFIFTPVNFDLPSADETLRYLDELTATVEAFHS